MSQLRRAAALALGVAAFTAACADGRAPAGAEDGAAVPVEERYGGTATVALFQPLPDLNPVTTVGTSAIPINRDLLFAPLFQRDEALGVVPYLVKSWGLSPDSTRLTLHLRDDIHWHDGVRTTAYDLELGYRLAKDPATGSIHVSALEAFGRAEVVDSFTLRVEMEPVVDFLAVFSAVVPLPRHVLGGVEPSALATHPYGRRPLGNGPFELVSVVPGQSWTFAANERFPESLGGRPYLDRIVFRYVPEPASRLTELLTGAAQVTLIEPQQREEVARSGTARVVRYPQPMFASIVWNTRRAPFRDPRVRRALTMAIDRRGIVDGILYGAGEVANSPFHPAVWTHDPVAGSELRHDPEAARALLAEAGWEDRDGDGVLENAAGNDFRFTLAASRASGTAADLVEKVASDLWRVGVAAKPRLLEGTTQLTLVQQRDYDAAYFAELVRPYASNRRDTFHCASREVGNVHSGICDPELDRLIELLPSLVDREVAKPYWDRYQRRLAVLQPFTGLYYPEETLGVSDDLHDVHPDARGPYAGAQRWWLVPAAR